VINKNSSDVVLSDPEIKIRVYPANEGEEIFLSFEDTKYDVVFGFLRLRLPSDQAHRPEISETPSALVRELHVYGEAVGVGLTPEERPEIWQHKGLGKQLLNRAEEILIDKYEARQMLVTSGIGVRAYYQKLGFYRRGAYMAKDLP
jgi:elongator complex protein 3